MIFKQKTNEACNRFILCRCNRILEDIPLKSFQSEL